MRKLPLFGSHGTEAQTALSDVDLAFLFRDGGCSRRRFASASVSGGCAGFRERGRGAFLFEVVDRFLDVA